VDLGVHSRIYCCTGLGGAEIQYRDEPWEGRGQRQIKVALESAAGEVRFSRDAARNLCVIEWNGPR